MREQQNKLPALKAADYAHRVVQSISESVCHWMVDQWTLPWENIPSDMCLTKTQINLHNLCSLISLHWQHEETWLFKMHPGKILIRLCKCAGWSECSRIFCHCGSHYEIVCSTVILAGSPIFHVPHGNRSSEVGADIFNLERLSSISRKWLTFSKKTICL